MYNALAGLGGAGQVDTKVQNNAGIGLHSAFAVFGLIVGSIHNYMSVFRKGYGPSFCGKVELTVGIKAEPK